MSASPHVTPPEPSFFSLCTMLDEHETDVFAAMMEAAKVSSPSNMVRIALYKCAQWYALDLAPGDFQLRRGAPPLPRTRRKDAPV